VTALARGGRVGTPHQSAHRRSAMSRPDDRRLQRATRPRTRGEARSEATTPRPASRPAALRLTSGPEAAATFTSPASLHCISPWPSTNRSNPPMTPATRARQRNPRPGARVSVERNGSHRFNLMEPRIRRRIAAARRVPGAIAAVNIRRTSSGNCPTSSLEKLPG